MADNVGYTPGTGALVAADEIAGVLHQRVKIGVGADGTAVDVSAANPMPITAPSALSVTGTVGITAAAPIDVQGSVSVSNFPATQPVSGSVSVSNFPATQAVTESDPSTATSFGPITTANTVLFAAADTANEKMAIVQLTGQFTGGVQLQASNDGTTYWPIQGYVFNGDGTATDTFSTIDTIFVPLAARLFRVITTNDFTGTVSGAYSLRTTDYDLPYTQTTLVNNDPAYSVPITAIDQNNYPTKIRANNFGQLVPADAVRFVNGRMGLGTIVSADTTGYNSIILQLTGTWSGTVTFQVSNDGSTWTAVIAWPVGGAAVPVSTATANGQWIIPTAGRFFRAQVTTATSGLFSADLMLRNAPAYLPWNIPSYNLAQVAGTAAVTAGVAGMLAVGGNIAEDNAATSNPIISGGVVRTALPATTVVAGDAIRATYSASGQMITKENAPGDLDFYVSTTVTTNTQTAIRIAQGASIRQNVTGITFQNTNATATTLTIQDGSTTLVTFSVPVSMTLPVQLNFPTPLRGTANTALNYTAGTTGASVLLTVTGFNSY